MVPLHRESSGGADVDRGGKVLEDNQYDYYGMTSATRAAPAAWVGG
jgi:hypothetical protein